MGYFSNGSEGHDYQTRYCSRCIHDVNQDCPVWGAHLTYNSDSCRDRKLRELLNVLIPMTENGLWNKQCAMFVPVAREVVPQ